MEIDTLKLTNRPFKITDVDDFMLHAGDNEVTRHLRRKTITAKDKALAFIKDVCIPHPWTRSIGIDDRSIGFVSIFRESGDDRCRAQLGYGVSKEYWNKGVATRAVQMACNQVFEDYPDLVRLEAFVLVENRASQRVLEKCNFVREGLLRKYSYVKGELKDLLLYSFLSTELPSGDQ